MDAPQRLALIENGLIWDPQNQALLQSLLDPLTSDAAAVVQPTTARIQGAAVRGLIQAIEASRRKRPERVRPELALALTISGPQMAAIASNLACVWADSKAPDAACALTFSTVLLELLPSEAVAQRAQGIVLVKQEQWAQAIEHLNAALLASPDDLGVHASLATAYEKLGNSDLADRHRRLSQPTTAATPTPSTSPATGPSAAMRVDHK